MRTFPRSSGILLHPTMLPGPCGIGALGEYALSFLDWLKKAGQSYWQICPLVPTGYGDSPYQGFSAFAGNPNLIDLDELVYLGMLNAEDISPLGRLPDSAVDFGRLIPLKSSILRQAWKRFSSGAGSRKLHQEFSDYRKDISHRLEEYGLFMAIKENQGGKPWYQWPTPLRFREGPAMEKIKADLENAQNYHLFLQFIFNKQWMKVKREAHRKGIHIIGDIPIFVSYDSSDCWANPEIFQLDEDRCPAHVAGVPPDYFSATGQLWGNPLYNWSAMEQDGFEWWLSLLKNKFEQYDALRIDHFRGFVAYWAVPYGEETAVNGQWVSAPGEKLFRKVNDLLKDPPIIAEDLGVITDDVRALMQECGFPGMKVLQFAFDSSEENNYLPHNYGRHCLVYTGTHDNDTTAGWYETAAEGDKAAMRGYLKLPEGISGRQAAEAIVKAAMYSKAALAVTPIQDILGLGSEARFNTPGQTHGNWSWRVPKDAFSPQLADNLWKLTQKSDRLAQKLA